MVHCEIRSLACDTLRNTNPSLWYTKKYDPLPVVHYEIRSLVWTRWIKVRSTHRWLYDLPSSLKFWINTEIQKEVNTIKYSNKNPKVMWKFYVPIPTQIKNTFNDISHRPVRVPQTTDENPLFPWTHESVYFLWKFHVLNKLDTWSEYRTFYFIMHTSTCGRNTRLPFKTNPISLAV